MITNYVPIDSIIEQLDRDYIPGTHWNIEELKEWSYEALSKIDKKLSNIGVSDVIEVKDGKSKIPADVELLTKVFRDAESGKVEIFELLPGHELDDTTYIVNQGFIHVYFSNGKLYLNYFTTPVDTEGRPMIPDTVYYKAAVTAYLQYKIGRRAFFAGKILQNQLTMLEQEWYFYNNSAKNEQRMDILQNSKRFRRLANKFRL